MMTMLEWKDWRRDMDFHRNKFKNTKSHFVNSIKMVRHPPRFTHTTFPFIRLFFISLGDGHADADEIIVIMKKLQLPSSRSEVNKLIAEVDKDGNGTIEFDEFLWMIKKLQGQFALIGVLDLHIALTLSFFFFFWFSALWLQFTTK